MIGRLKTRLDVLLVQRAKARRMVKQYGIKCIVMDTMMTSDEKKQALALAAISAQRRR